MQEASHEKYWRRQCNDNTKSVLSACHHSVEAVLTAGPEPPMEVVAAVVLTTLFAGALAVIFGVTALRNARTH